MTFWQLSAYPDDAAVFIEHGQVITAARLHTRLSEAEDALTSFGRKTLGVIAMRTTLDAVVWYLAALRTAQAVLLVDAALEETRLQALVDRYQPDWLVQPAEGGYGFRVLQPAQTQPPLYPDLAVLLSTSGSTGSPKLVRLSYRNLAVNAASITEYLGLTAADRAITTLPLHYSYGLSILHSHLLAGGSVVLTEDGVMTPGFWQALGQGVTSLSGVPFVWEMLLRLGFERKAPPSLHTLTQAGGKLAEDRARALAAIAQERGWRLFLMYGQTEATARISYLPPEWSARKPGAIGVPIPGGRIERDGATGELIYHGPNVMLGYAESRADLALGDLQGGTLRTGDVGEQDEAGLWRITGRLKRFIKLFGLRVNLQEVEEGATALLNQPAACTGHDDALSVWITDAAAVTTVRNWLAESLRLHPSACTVQVVAELPRTASGKVDYPALERMAHPPTGKPAP